jgi:hypothetical protein
MNENKTASTCTVAIPVSVHLAVIHMAILVTIFSLSRQLYPRLMLSSRVLPYGVLLYPFLLR